MATTVATVSSMNDDEIFRVVAAERRDLADVLEGLTPNQWSTPSLCGAWTVREVAGHLLMPMVVPLPKFALGMLTCGFNFDKANTKLSKEVAEQPTAEIVAGLRTNAEHRFTPPGSGPIAPLTDVLIHGQDIRRPLGLQRVFPTDPIVLVLDGLAGGSRAIVPRQRVDGLRFTATDIDWSAGPDDGASVSGTAEAILLSIAGRTVALDDLSGDGAGTLRSRLD